MVPANQGKEQGGILERKKVAADTEKEDNHPSVPWGIGSRTPHGHQDPRMLKSLTFGDLHPRGQPTTDGSEVC